MWLVVAGPLRAGSRLASDSAVGGRRLGPGRCVFFYLNSDVAPLSLRLAKTDSETSTGARRKLLGGQLQPRQKRKRKRKGKQRVEDRGG
jgi:hypothetical protein